MISRFFFGSEDVVFGVTFGPPRSNILEDERQEPTAITGFRKEIYLNQTSVIVFQPLIFQEENIRKVYCDRKAHHLLKVLHTFLEVRFSLVFLSVSVVVCPLLIWSRSMTTLKNQLESFSVAETRCHCCDSNFGSSAWMSQEVRINGYCSIWAVTYL